jgi:hypothetical protein
MQPGGHGQPVQARHVNVQHGHVGPGLDGNVQYPVPAVKLGDHLNVGFQGQQGDQRAPDQVLVFGDEHPDAVQ